MYDSSTDEYQGIRDAVRALCAEFPDAYHRRIDEARGYESLTLTDRQALGRTRGEHTWNEGGQGDERRRARQEAAARQVSIA